MFDLCAVVELLKGYLWSGHLFVQTFQIREKGIMSLLHMIVKVQNREKRHAEMHKIF